MEPKLIKEEVLEREGVPRHHQGSPTSRVRHKAGSKERVKTPDSPEGARLMSNSPHTTAVCTTSGTTGTTGTTGAQLAASNGDNMSPTALLNGTPGGHVTPPLPPSTALSLSMLESSQSGVRTLSKIKRFLSTLVQFGGDIGQDTGDRVRTLVFSLVSNAVTIEEFHHSLQDVTNFPLRPFVVPFLRAHLPQLQREITLLARAAKQTCQQYLRQHEHVVLDPAFSPTEPSEIFHSELNDNGKRKPAGNSYYENGLSGTTDACTDYVPAPKRHHPLLLQHTPGLLFSPPHVPPPPHLHPSADYAQQYYPQQYPSSTAPDFVERRQGDDEWKNIHVMLNCILSMVEKTKRALAILQHRGANPENGANTTTDWLRRPAQSEATDARDIKRTAGEIMAQTIRVTEDRVAEVKRRAEEAVNEVKRQAVAELQRAVTAAESKACELVATERAKMEKLLLEARKQAAEEALAAVVGTNQQQAESSDSTNVIPAPSQQNSCWNCGRKANETCSGCNTARYCGSFCQHKDWENHHQVCCGRPSTNPIEKPQPVRSRSATPVSAPSSTNPGIEIRAKK